MNQPVQTKQYWDGGGCLRFWDFEWAGWLAQASRLLSCPILKSNIWITALDSIQDAWYFIMWTEQDCKPNFPTVYTLFSVWRTSNYSLSAGERTAVLPWACAQLALLESHRDLQSSPWTFWIHGNGERLDKIKILRSSLRWIQCSQVWEPVAKMPEFLNPGIQRLNLTHRNHSWLL